MMQSEENMETKDKTEDTRDIDYLLDILSKLESRIERLEMQNQGDSGIKHVECKTQLSKME